MSLERYSDVDLRQLAKENRITNFGVRRVGERREVVGEAVVFADVLTILGSERGLWDEMGYEMTPAERVVDLEFSQICHFLACELWYQDLNGEHPLLVKLILLLKHGIRSVDDDSLVLINRLVTERWFQEESGDEIFNCRLETLRQAIAVVLADRGYEVQLGHV